MAEQSRNHRIEVARLGSGWAAIHVADYADMDWNTDIVNSGVGRYATREEAVSEAQDWAEAEELPYQENSVS